MGLFFKNAKRKKSSKPITVIKILLLIGVFTLFIIGFRNDFDLYYLGIAFVLVGLVNIITGAESHYHQEKKKVYIPDYLLGVMFFIMAITYIS